MSTIASISFNLAFSFRPSVDLSHCTRDILLTSWTETPCFFQVVMSPLQTEQI